MGPVPKTSAFNPRGKRLFLGDILIYLSNNLKHPKLNSQKTRKRMVL